VEKLLFATNLLPKHFQFASGFLRAEPWGISPLSYFTIECKEGAACGSCAVRCHLLLVPSPKSPVPSGIFDIRRTPISWVALCASLTAPFEFEGRCRSSARFEYSRAVKGINDTNSAGSYFRASAGSGANTIFMPARHNS